MRSCSSQRIAQQHRQMAWAGIAMDAHLLAAGKSVSDDLSRGLVAQGGHQIPFGHG